MITGGASGIGLATAERLARAGCALALVDIKQNTLDEAAARVRALGARCSTHIADVSDRAVMAALPARVREAHDAIHILMNNAGVASFGKFEGHSLEDFEWVLGINLWGVIHGCKFFLPHLREADEGHIVNTASMAAFVGMPGQSSYCVSKSGVRALGQSLAAELHGTPIGITTVLPGAVETGIVAGARGSDANKRTISELMRSAIPPGEVARRIEGAILENETELVVCREAHAMHWASRLVPGGLRRVLARSNRIES